MDNATPTMIPDLDVEPDGPCEAEADYYRALLAAGFPNRRVPTSPTWSGATVLCADPSRDRIEFHIRVEDDGRIADIGYRPLSVTGVAAEDTADILCRIVREDRVRLDTISEVCAARFLEVLGGPGPRVLFRTGPALSAIYTAAIRYYCAHGRAAGGLVSLGIEAPDAGAADVADVVRLAGPAVKAHLVAAGCRFPGGAASSR